MTIRLMIADDHKIVRHGLIRLVKQEPRIEIVGESSNGLNTVEMVRELKPDIVLMDIGMPQLNGIEATRQIMHDFDNVKIISLSMYSSAKFIIEMFKAGAAGYLLKDCTAEELIEAIKIVADGKNYLSPSITDVVVKNYVGGPSSEDKSVFSVLTQREREVLQLLSEGNTTKQIAMKLYISPKTVEAHRLRIMNKLDIDSVANLTKYAVKEGLTLLES